MTAFHSINPATEAVLSAHPSANEIEIDAALSRAQAAFEAWRGFTPEARVTVLAAIADLIDARRDELAQIASLEMGKPLVQARAEVEKSALLARRLAATAPANLAPQARPIPDFEAQVRYAPLGPLLSITPWNFPFWQIARAAFPALAAGNVVINKPAPNVIGCAKALAEIAAQAGLPAGVLSVLVLTNEDAGRVIADPRIVGVSLTGSERAGAAVASLAGAHLKKVVLELGGSDPFLVFADADVEAAAKAAATLRFVNAGQVCIAAKRFLVQAPVLARFEEAFLAHVDALTLGDPLASTTTLGPLARGDLRDALEAQAAATVAAGARVLRRGGPAEGPGFHYAPTVVVDPDLASPAMAAETFGPLAAIVSFATEADAARLANATPYGLSASLWTADAARADRIADAIEAGGVFINTVTASHPDLPFGGIKRSGFGRELGREGLLEFVNIKTVMRPTA